MNNEDNPVLSVEGTVTMDLKSYNYMRDTLEHLYKTTDTHKEFLKKFRVSLAVIIGKAQFAGLDMSEMYEYFKDLDFPVIERVVILHDEEASKWRVKIKKIEDEKIDSTTDGGQSSDGSNKEGK